MTESTKQSKGRPMCHPLHTEAAGDRRARRKAKTCSKSKRGKKPVRMCKEFPSILCILLTPSPKTGTIKSILKPVTVRKIEQAVKVKKIEQPVIVKKILKPVRVREIDQPIDVQSISTPVSVFDIQTPVTVKDIEQQVDIRPLNPAEDGVTIFGSNTEIPVQTDDEGRLIFSGEVKFPPVTFTQKVFAGLVSEDFPQFLTSQDVSLQTTFSYAVINHSVNPVLVQLEISPNDNDYNIDSEMTVDGQAMKILTPLRFLKYSRIAYISAESGKSTTFDVYYQAQSG